VLATATAALVASDVTAARHIRDEWFRGQLHNSDVVLRALSRRAAKLLGRVTEQPDLILQYGSTFTSINDIPFATYEDMTVVQAARVPQWPQAHMSRVTLKRRIRYQREVYERALACFTATRWAKESIVTDYAIPDDKVTVVGVGRNHHPRVTTRDWSRPRFLFIGRDWERKNGPMLLRAMAELRRERPDAELSVVGCTPVGIEQAGVTFHGSLPLSDPEATSRLEALFESSTCFVLPSVHEPAGISYVEAMSAGLPVIGTAAGGSADIIGDAGVVVEPSSQLALLDALRMMTQRSHAERFAQRAVQQAQGYTWKGVVDRMLAALDGRYPARAEL
jgi:glycosyltransferase involved in cell wall biosynthesis